MFGVCKMLRINVKSRNRNIATPVSYFCSSSSNVLDEQKQKFTESYFVHSCGLSPKVAVRVSKLVGLETPEKPNLVLSFLKNHGFCHAHISKVIQGRPTVLLQDPEKTILPRLEFFRSIGLSDIDRANIISSCPCVLSSSLENHLMPLYNVLKAALGTDEKVVITLKKMKWLLSQNVEKNLVPNLTHLREIGVSQSYISVLVTTWPRSASILHSKFVKIVEEVRDMGFDSFDLNFIQAIRVLSGMKKVNWEYKFEVYGRWGWSKDQTLLAFKKRPQIMILSEDKITKMMDFIINKAGWPSSDIARDPLILTFSLEKRIIPRCSVVQILRSKGLIKKQISIIAICKLVDKVFVEKYVTKFQKECPQLLSVYQEALDLPDEGIKSLRELQKARGSLKAHENTVIS